MYDWTKWLDHVITPANSYVIEENGDGTCTITPTGTVMQEGTPQDQQHFNNIENGMVDAYASVALLLNYARQNSWEIETGSVILTNTLKFPFNDSQQTISLTNRKENTGYVVLTEITSVEGNIGEVKITDKLLNGFKIAYTGSASTVTIKYTVIGGIMK